MEREASIASGRGRMEREEPVATGGWRMEREEAAATGGWWMEREEPATRGWRMERAQVLPRPVEEVFRFFQDPWNLERITPPLLRFRIVTPGPIPMGPGALIDYRLRLHGVPLRWRTRIETWDPPHAFTDVQVRGPYRRWVHRHTFEEVSRGTLMRDRVEYEIGLGLLEGIVRRSFVRPALRDIFDFRRDATSAILGS